MSDTMRICKKCNVVLPIEDFTIHYGNVRRHRCKKCTEAYLKDYRDKNREHIRKSNRERYTKDEWSEFKRKYYIKNKQKLLLQMKRRVEQNREQRKKYLKDTRKERQRVAYEYIKTRKEKDIGFRIQMNLRARVRSALKRSSANKKDSFNNLIGCSVSDFNKHIENQFVEGMSWTNYGFGPDKWVIDHIRPCCSFDLTETEQQKQCFHWSNCQPMWWADNQRKMTLDRKISVL